MPQQPNKRSKDKQVDTIRRYIAGEDILCELLNTAIIINWFETHNLFDAEDRIMINGKPCTMEQYEQELAKSSFAWIEERSYQKAGNVPKIEDTVNTEVSVNIEKVENKASNEPKTNAQLIEAKEVINRGKQYLKDKLKEFADQEKIDREIRDKSLFWMRMQNTL